MHSQFGWGVNRIMSGGVSWRLACDLSHEVMRDPYSHSNSALANWSYIPHPSDVLFLNWVDATATMHHQPGRVKPRPVKRPWEGGAPQDRITLPDPDRNKRRAELRGRLGLN